VRRQFGNRERVRLLAASLAESVTTTYMDRRARAQVGQREVHASIAAVGRAEQTKERLILIDGQQLPVALRPAFRRKDKGHDSDFTEKRFGHAFLLT
jgi:hypothetical protein